MADLQSYERADALPNVEDPMQDATGKHRSANERRSRGRLVAAVATPVALLVSGALVWHSTYAAFTAQITNNASSWSAGTVVLQGDDSSNSTTAAKGSAMFTATNMKPGDTNSKCLLVTYNGTITTVSAVKLYVKAADLTGSAPLQGQINLVIKEGTGGTAASCASFVSSATVYTGTLSGMPATYGASTAGTWVPTAAGQTKSYQITWTLNGNAPDTVQGTTAGAAFTWETDNT
jgi:hypothetical protein